MLGWAFPDEQMATFEWQPEVLHLVTKLITHIEKALDHVLLNIISSPCDWARVIIAYKLN